MTKYKGKKVLKGYPDDVVRDVKELVETTAYPLYSLMGFSDDISIKDDYQELSDFITYASHDDDIKLMKEIAKYFRGKAIFEQDLPTSDDKEPLYYLINPDIKDENKKYLNFDTDYYTRHPYIFDDKSDNEFYKTQFTQEEIEKIPIFGLEKVEVPDDERADE